MNYKEEAQLFFNNQKSIKEAVQSFINVFLDIYNDEGKAEKELLSKCIQQMFRKYYYSALLPESVFTPASIVNTLFEREFGKKFSVLPTIKLEFNGKKIKEITQDISCFSTSSHPMVNDMLFLLKTAEDGLEIDSSGLIKEKEFTKLKKDLLIFDSHYINILTLTAIEAGYLEIQQSGQSSKAKTTSKATDYFEMNDKLKLKELIKSVTYVCSKNISQAFPVLKNQFTYDAVTSMLKKPRDTNLKLNRIYKKFGYEIDELHEYFENILYNNTSPEPRDFERLMKVFEFQSCFDIYFLTPFGFYLQLIQPIYPEPYYMYGEVDTLLSSVDDYNFARNILFVSAPEYDLTILGDKLFNNGRKSIRNQTLEAEEDDDSLYDTVLFSQDFDEDDDYDYDDYEDDDYDEEFADDYDDNFDEKEIKKYIHEILNEKMPDILDKHEPAKVLDFNERKNAIIKNRQKS